jgi:type I restriction enzyme S subunit
MRVEWREYQIADIADVIGGSTPSTKDPSNFDGDIPWLTPKDLSGTHERYVTGGERTLTKKGLESCSAQLLPVNSVLLSSRAPIGYVAIAKNPLTTNQGFRNLILKPGFDPGFVYYWLKANTRELERHASGSTFREISGSSLKKIHISVPNSKTQVAIAHILGTLDDKIELNRRMNETLEAIARAIFKSWFVDFDPVRAKAAGRDPGLPKHIADLFSDRFEDSELGEIPEGWGVTRIGDVAKCVRGRSYRSADLSVSDTALVTLKSFNRGGGYRHDGLKAYTGKYKEDQVIQPGEVVVACTDVTQAAEVIGRAALIPASDSYRTLVASLDVLIVRSQHKELSAVFLYLLFGTDMFTNYTYSYSTGTTVLHLSKEAVPKYQFVLPPVAVLELFNEFMSKIFGRIALAENETPNLTYIRDILLPKLISGELRLKDAERFLKERGL